VPQRRTVPSNLIAKQKVLFIVLAQMHFIQCKQFSETIVTSQAFQQISDLKCFPECFRGPLKTLWWVTCGPRACSWTTLFYTTDTTSTTGMLLILWQLALTQIAKLMWNETVTSKITFPACVCLKWIFLLTRLKFKSGVKHLRNPGPKYASNWALPVYAISWPKTALFLFSYACQTGRQTIPFSLMRPV